MHKFWSYIQKVSVTKIYTIKLLQPLHHHHHQDWKPTIEDRFYCVLGDLISGRANCEYEEVLKIFWHYSIHNTYIY